MQINFRRLHLMAWKLVRWQAIVRRPPNPSALPAIRSKVLNLGTKNYVNKKRWIQFPINQSFFKNSKSRPGNMRQRMAYLFDKQESQKLEFE